MLFLGRLASLEMEGKTEGPEEQGTFVEVGIAMTHGRAPQKSGLERPLFPMSALQERGLSSFVFWSLLSCVMGAWHTASSHYLVREWMWLYGSGHCYIKQHPTSTLGSGRIFLSPQIFRTSMVPEIGQSNKNGSIRVGLECSRRSFEVEAAVAVSQAVGRGFPCAGKDSAGLPRGRSCHHRSSPQ